MLLVHCLIGEEGVVALFTSNNTCLWYKMEMWLYLR